MFKKKVSWGGGEGMGTQTNQSKTQPTKKPE